MLRVVLADDENKVILLMQKLIDWEALGYEIAGTANDGLRALELVREKQPHLLITDVRDARLRRHRTDPEGQGPPAQAAFHRHQRIPEI